MKERLTAIAIGGLLLASSQAQAVLLVYEPFNYTTGTASGSGVVLAGQSGGTGMTGSWSTFTTGQAGNNAATVYQEGNLSGVNFNTGQANAFDGTYSNLPHSGGYFGSITSLGGTPTATTTDHMQAWRSLDPSVTATFTDGSTTWFSFVSARAFNANATATRFAIGAAELKEDRGHLANGQAIGVGGGLNANIYRVHAQYWDDLDPNTVGVYNIKNAETIQIATGAAGTVTIDPDYFYWEVGTVSPGTTTLDANSGIPNIIIGKIEWHDGSPDIISFARFLESDTLSEANFNSVALSSASWAIDLDQSQFDTISFAGGKYFADELRIGTTFNDIIGASVDPVPSPAALPAGLAVMGLAFARRRRSA